METGHVRLWRQRVLDGASGADAPERIFVELQEDYCQHYCIVDWDVVWYGSKNFLGKEDNEDNLMRVCSKEIAAELLELTFGSEKVDGESV